ncbi:MAG: tRNA uridine(34) 5-carboxymethylaminomethyl modification radical SAM/GNAT enzyme Elp3 [Nitrososphaerales archaeon]
MKAESLTASREIANRLSILESAKRTPLDLKAISRVKLLVCKEYGLDRVPKNSEILEFLDGKERAKFESRLRRKSVRTKSGIAVVTVITKPFECPHGTCIFCPGGVRFGTPQSYTKNSPAAAFGMARDYDPKRQVVDMLSFLEDNGHNTSKIEMILLGGTVLAMPKEYVEDFVRRCYEALNERESLGLEDAIRTNETAAHRSVGLTIETKPDWCREEHVDRLLSYGTTRVEIGVQSLREDVLKFANRGHDLGDTIRAFRLLKDSSLKVVAHMMPGLPKSDPDKDLGDLLNLVEDQKYRPDMLKIYPTLVVEGTALYKLYRIGGYKPYDLEQLKEILCRFKSRVPPWMRIMRIHREIPKEEIADGTNGAGNLRQIILEEMERRSLKCRCIRCREVGRKGGEEGKCSSEEKDDGLSLKRINYASSGGEEVFISFEDERSDSLSAFLRLRIPSGSEYRREIRGQDASLVRELHVYGTVVPIGERRRPGYKKSDQPQHTGLGSRLLLEAERISKEEYSKKKIIVISAVGTREYYRRRGYSDDGVFVSKEIRSL